MTQSITVWLPQDEVPMLSSQGFEKLFSKTLSSLRSIKEYQFFQSFFQRVYVIISSREVPPTNQFYALYLVFRLLDKTDEIFPYQLALHKELVPFIQKVAQFQANTKLANDERGINYFNKTPSKHEALVGVNFVRLSLEFLVYLQRRYKSASSSEPWKHFFFDDSAFQKRINLCSYYYFVDRDYDLSTNFALWNYRNKLPPLKVEEKKILIIPETNSGIDDEEDEYINRELNGDLSGELDLLPSFKQLHLEAPLEGSKRITTPKASSADLPKLLDKWKQEEITENNLIPDIYKQQEPQQVSRQSPKINNILTPCEQEIKPNLENKAADKSKSGPNGDGLYEDSNEGNQETKNKEVTDGKKRQTETDHSSSQNHPIKLECRIKANVPESAKVEENFSNKSKTENISNNIENRIVSSSGNAEKAGISSPHKPKISVGELVPSQNLQEKTERQIASPGLSSGKLGFSFSNSPRPSVSESSPLKNFSEKCPSPSTEKSDTVSPHKLKLSAGEPSPTKSVPENRIASPVLPPGKSHLNFAIGPKPSVSESLPSQNVASKIEGQILSPSLTTEKPKAKLSFREYFSPQDSPNKTEGLIASPVISSGKGEASCPNKKPNMELLSPESCKKTQYSYTPLSLHSEKVGSNFSSFNNTPQNKYTNKVAAELLEISKSIERSKVKSSSFRSTTAFKTEELESPMQTSDSKDISSNIKASPRHYFSSIFAEKNDKLTRSSFDIPNRMLSPSNQNAHEGNIDLPETKFTRSGSKSKTTIQPQVDRKNYSPKVVVWSEEKDGGMGEIRGAKAINSYSDTNLEPRKKNDPFNKNQHSKAQIDKEFNHMNRTVGRDGFKVSKPKNVNTNFK